MPLIFCQTHDNVLFFFLTHTTTSFIKREKRVSVSFFRERNRQSFYSVVSKADLVTMAHGLIKALRLLGLMGLLGGMEFFFGRPPP